MKLEDFNAEALEDLVYFCEQRVDRNLLNTMLDVVNSLPNKSTKEFSMLPKEEWADEENKQFYRFATPMMKRLDYL